MAENNFVNSLILCVRARPPLSLLQPAGNVLGVIGDDDICSGPFEAEHGLKHDPLFIDPALGRRCLDHAVFPRDVVDSQRQVVFIAQVAQDVKIGQTRFDHDDVGALFDV